MTRSTHTAHTREALAIQFPPSAGEVMQFEASADAFRDYDGPCRIRIARALDGTEADLDEVGPMFRCVCLNGSAKNGAEFDAYESELSR